jgi:hypothetical protein
MRSLSRTGSAHESRLGFSLQYECTATLNTSPETAFAYLDDFKNLSAHMEKSSAKLLVICGRLFQNGGESVMITNSAKSLNTALLFVLWMSLSLALMGQVRAQQSQSETATPPQAEQMQQMQSHMQTMHEQMARIHAATDPEERQRLMQEHMRTMHEGMTMMGCMMGPMAQGPAQQCQQGDNECRMDQMQMQQQMMGQRMGMMQQMMEQMMEIMMQAQEPATAPSGDAEQSHDSHH